MIRTSARCAMELAAALLMLRSNCVSVYSGIGIPTAERLVAQDEALATLFRLHSNEITDSIYRRTGSRELAVDLTQDTFVRYHTAAVREQVENPRAMLFRIAKNLIVDHFRRTAAWNDRFSSEPLADDEPADGRSSAEQQLMERQEYERFCAVVESMPRICRQVFILKKINGLSYAQIAEHLGMSEAAVEKHIVRGLKFCREKLAR